MLKITEMTLELADRVCRAREYIDRKEEEREQRKMEIRGRWFFGLASLFYILWIIEVLYAG